MTIDTSFAATFFADPLLEGCARVSLGTSTQNGIVFECLETLELGGAVS